MAASPLFETLTGALVSVTDDDEPGASGISIFNVVLGCFSANLEGPAFCGGSGGFGKMAREDVLRRAGSLVGDFLVFTDGALFLAMPCIFCK